MFGENDQCGAVLGWIAMWRIEVEGQERQIDGLFIFIFIGLAFGEMDLVAIPVGVSVDLILHGM